MKNILGNNFYQVVSFKHKLIFLTPPRCSTYSLKLFLDNNKIEMDEPIRPLSTPFYHATLSEIIYSYDIDINDLPHFKIIQIVRNPYDRFISSFQKQNEIFSTKFNLEDFIYKVEKYKYLLPYSLNEFYLNFYQNEEFKILQHNLNQHGGVRFFYEQNWWNNLNKKVYINYFKLEDINNNISSLCNLLNIDKTNIYPIENKSFKQSLNLSLSEKNKIYNLFKKDFEMFNYERI